VALSPFQLLLQPHNLYWAFRKAEALYEKSDAVFDRAELARFNLFLEEELDQIRADFQDASYRLAPMRLLPMPKKGKDGRERMRQGFQFSIRDQVAWIALVNVLGPELDRKMPRWSYGHRLYRRRFFTRLGPQYRYFSSTNLYREFRNSWPLFRSHIAASSYYALKIVERKTIETRQKTTNRCRYSRHEVSGVPDDHQRESTQRISIWSGFTGMHG
jgi:hypothetical protein